MSKRFDTNIGVDDVIASQYNKSTLRNDKYAEKLLKEFCVLKNFDYNRNSSLSEWDSLLCEFFVSTKKNDGTDFHAASLHSLRYSISRLLKAKLDIDIISNDNFKKCSNVHKAMIRKLKKSGKGCVKHFDVICDEDLKKIADMPSTTPIQLQWRVWLNIMLHFLNRGRENIHELKKTDVEVLKRFDGKRMLKLRDFQTKNHQGDDGRRSTEAILIETEDLDCPVALFELYISKLHPMNDFLWQKAKNTYNETDTFWYTNKRIGLNTISNFMQQISQYLHLSKNYTNHCLRATGITILGRHNFQDTEIAAFSGHTSISALSIYKRTPDNVKKRMSSALHDSLSHQSTSSGLKAMPTLQETCSISTATVSSHEVTETHPNIVDVTCDPDDLLLNSFMQEFESSQISFSGMFNNCSITNINFNIVRK
jgi:hypothetical protein